MRSLPNSIDYEREEIRLSLDLLKRTVTDNPYIPIFPTEPQAVFLTAPVSEIMFGGAAGGGKSMALLAAALQYVQEPGYAALLLRRSYADLMLPEALIPMAKDWLYNTDAKEKPQQHEWEFPSGATLTFGYLDTEQDKYRYQGAAFNFIGFDELTQFTESQYRYLFSRLRSKQGSRIPLRMRSSTNPGGVGHEWVYNRFISSNDEGRLFIPAKRHDNPYLDNEAYGRSLAQLDPVTRAQLDDGDWNIRPEGNLFRREWFNGHIISELPAVKRWVRYWDLAATKQKDQNDPDYAAGCRMVLTDTGRFAIADMKRFREGPEQVEQRLVWTAEEDTTKTAVRIEQEPGSASKLYIGGLASRLLQAYDVQGTPSLTDKVTRAKPFSAACSRGQVDLLAGDWVGTFLDELCAFPLVAHDDQVDAATGAYNELAGKGEISVRVMQAGSGARTRPSDAGWTKL